eukprot:TRINITY_DN3441_c0_g1_i6.p1 TRINITY_DN3441_c0_g1~~TRINITY_DN3441_c0_g1_i6.p1  ORF type:complete len:904 (+),score=224.60 TRINITY_DN3441_c0_g1_i6:114-2825(+)
MCIRDRYQRRVRGKMLTVKCQLGNRSDDLRRRTVPALDDLAHLRALVIDLFEMSPHAAFEMLWSDDDGDLITLDSDNDLLEAINSSMRDPKSPLRVVVRNITEPASAEKLPEPEPEPEIVSSPVQVVLPTSQSGSQPSRLASLHRQGSGKGFCADAFSDYIMSQLAEQPAQPAAGESAESEPSNSTSEIADLPEESVPSEAKPFQIEEAGSSGCEPTLWERMCRQPSFQQVLLRNEMIFAHQKHDTVLLAQQTDEETDPYEWQDPEMVAARRKIHADAKSAHGHAEKAAAMLQEATQAQEAFAVEKKAREARIQTLKKQVQTVINQYAIPMLNAGRIVQVKGTWGAVHKYEASTNSVDAVLQVRGELSAVTVPLDDLDAVSSIRIFMPGSVQSPTAMERVGIEINDVIRCFSSQIPLLDPAEDLSINELRFDRLTQELAELQGATKKKSAKKKSLIGSQPTVTTHTPKHTPIEACSAPQDAVKPSGSTPASNAAVPVTQGDNATTTTTQMVQPKPTETSEECCSVFVGNLPYNADSNVLWEHFRECGRITDARVVKDREGQSKGFGYVEFTDQKSAAQAVDDMNGSKLDGRRTQMDGRRITVALAAQKGTRRKVKAPAAAPKQPVEEVPIVIEKGSEVLYKRTNELGTVLKAHHDDTEPYFTISMPDGREKQTTADRIEAVQAVLRRLQADVVLAAAAREAAQEHCTSEIARGASRLRAELDKKHSIFVSEAKHRDEVQRLAELSEKERAPAQAAVYAAQAKEKEATKALIEFKQRVAATDAVPTEKTHGATVREESSHPHKGMPAPWKEAVAGLVAMGFTARVASEAVVTAEGNFDAALDCAISLSESWEASWDVLEVELCDMGFTDHSANRNAICTTKGDLKSSVALLMKAERAAFEESKR